MTRPPLLIVGHGTRSRLGVAEFGELVELVRKQPGAPAAVAGGFLELAPPPLSDAVAELVAAGHRRISVVPLVLVAAGHAKGDVPAALERERRRHPGVSFGYGRPLGPHPSLLTTMDGRVDAVLDRDLRADTTILLVGRGTTDPDANAELAKVARLFAEGRGFASVEYGFISLAEPGVPAALEQAQAFARDHPEIDVRCAGLLGATAELAELVLERFSEIDGADVRMNCDTCLYRVALPGFEHRVGAPQTPHDHPDDPAHAHSHGHVHEHHHQHAHG